MTEKLGVLLVDVPPADQGTLNFLEDMIESVEKEAWMNRSYNEMR